ncbi:SDR family NAD(P)-dependent oxidoreductase [Streptococcus thermophilus]|nr:SDR family NAD(P)-dependent oxidoreductase [Streptococcus thermophilus]MCE2064267.1 SDR family NAD(P)-dependent oxidoreductase [Streptococcus thermophilus]MCE2066009.1 SDR family NAD(P)-dependent oxidoreductase [Streptococcus thermophilus]
MSCQKNVLITGATSGIGEATAYAFAKEGENVNLTGRRVERLEPLKEELQAVYPGQKVWTFTLDVTDMEMVKDVCQAILKSVGQVHVLVNNAGLALGLTAYQDYEEWDLLTMLDTNVKGLMMVTRQILPSMVASNEGHIINMGSTAGIYAYAGAAVYSATKAAVKTFSDDGLRIDTIATDIKVTTIQPGIVETDFSQVRFHGDKDKAAKVYQGLEALQAQDIAEAVLYVTKQPRRVQISDMTIMANQQATGFTIHREE